MMNEWKTEGDNWFDRNSKKLEALDDPVMHLMHLYDLKPESVLEIGCANGYRLQAIKDLLGSDCYGFDISEKAIADGLSKYKDVSLWCDDLEKKVCFENNNRYDLVIVNFVLHWISRERIDRVMSYIEARVSDFKYLILGDFNTRVKRVIPYHHKEGMFTYCEDYIKKFADDYGFFEVCRMGWNARNHKYDPLIDTNNCAYTALLRKGE